MLEWAVDRLNMAPKMAGEQHITRFDPASLRHLLVDAVWPSITSVRFTV